MPELNKAYESLDERFKPIVLKILVALEEKGYVPMVVEGRRTVEQQRKKVKDGVSTTMKSYHLTGLAVDICDRRHMWNIPLNHDFWYDYGCIIDEMECDIGTLRWGGVWDKPSRWDVIEKSRDLDRPYLINWFFDGAHCELRLNP